MTPWAAWAVWAGTVWKCWSRAHGRPAASRARPKRWDAGSPSCWTASPPSGWRAQGKFRRGLEDFSAQTGRILGHLRNAAAGAPDDPRRREDLEAALRELAGLRRTARPMTSRGTDYAGLLQTRVRRNMAILREEDPQRAQELRQLQAKRPAGCGHRRPRCRAGGHGRRPGPDPGCPAHRRGRHGRPRGGPGHRPGNGSRRTARCHGAPNGPAALPLLFQPRRPAGLLPGPLRLQGRSAAGLAGTQATLARFTGEARASTQAALEAVAAVLQDRLAADADSFAHVQHQVDEKMRRAIRCALTMSARWPCVIWTRRRARDRRAGFPPHRRGLRPAGTGRP